MTRLHSWINRLFLTMRIPSLRITDVLEIIILAWLVYRFLVWIKTTRAWTLLKGIITILAVVLLVYILQMDTLIYLVNRGLSVAIITAVVVFQPELRRALESLGERQFISSLLPLDAMNNVEALFSDRTLNELVKGTAEMAKARTGALIVIMQNETLEEYERTGISIDAQVSSQLLINIFEHNTPLHDGAVVVRGDRITAATCYLPLSDNMALSKELGTRHRAGVGISEVTDSFTIIVSEETGYISTAYRGALRRDLTPDELRDQLVQLQNKSVSARKFKLWKRGEKSDSGEGADLPGARSDEDLQNAEGMENAAGSGNTAEPGLLSEKVKIVRALTGKLGQRLKRRKEKAEPEEETPQMRAAGEPDEPVEPETGQPETEDEADMEAGRRDADE